jgi:hypothetical protein
MLSKFKKFQVKDEKLSFVKGGVTPEEYCATNTMIMQSCFNRGDTACMAAAGAAWREHCGGAQR